MVNTYYRQICTRKLLLELCTVDDQVDLMQVQVDLEPTICYVDQEKFPAIMPDAVKCALSDFMLC